MEQERMIGTRNSEARKRLQEARGELEPKSLTEWHPVYTEMIPTAEYYTTPEPQVILTQK